MALSLDFLARRRCFNAARRAIAIGDDATNGRKIGDDIVIDLIEKLLLDGDDEVCTKFCVIIRTPLEVYRIPIT